MTNMFFFRGCQEASMNIKHFILKQNRLPNKVGWVLFYGKFFNFDISLVLDFRRKDTISHCISLINKYYLNLQNLNGQLFKRDIWRILCEPQSPTLMLQNFPKEPFQKEIWSFWSNKRAKVCQAFNFFTFQKTIFF